MEPLAALSPKGTSKVTQDPHPQCRSTLPGYPSHRMGSRFSSAGVTCWGLADTRESTIPACTQPPTPARVSAPSTQSLMRRLCGADCGWRGGCIRCNDPGSCTSHRGPGHNDAVQSEGSAKDRLFTSRIPLPQPCRSTTGAWAERRASTHRATRSRARFEMAFASVAECAAWHRHSAPQTYAVAGRSRCSQMPWRSRTWVFMRSSV